MMKQWRCMRHFNIVSKSNMLKRFSRARRKKREIHQEKVGVLKKQLIPSTTWTAMILNTFVPPFCVTLDTRMFK